MATILASRAPVMICPAMHTEMWEQASVQENLDILADRGVLIVPPGSGRLAGGDMGHGRLAEPSAVVAAVEVALTDGDLAGRTVLVTAGGTREPVDTVRYIGNRSSGKQGHAVAAEAVLRGADVVVVTTRPDQAPAGVRVVEVETAAEMAAACDTEAPNACLLYTSPSPRD